MALLRLTVASILGALPCLSILLLVASPSVGLLAGQVDTLELQFQWAYPLSVVDMKLVDIDQDGASEILVGFDSDSARVGVLDAVAQTMAWQSPGLPGSVATVAAGDRNLDGFFDIIAGGTAADGSAGTGFYQVFDGSDFESASTVVNTDSSVTALALYAPAGAEWPSVIAGTYWYHEYLFYVPPMEWNRYFSEGHVISFDGIALVPIDSSASGTVRCLEVFDLNRDGQAEVILGEDDCHVFIGHGPDYEEASISVRVIYPESSSVYELSYRYAGEEGGWYLRFDALIVGEAHGYGHPRVIAGYREFYSDYSGYPQLTRWLNLRCLDPSTDITTWIQTDSGLTDRITGLDLCDLSGKSVRVVCASCSSGHPRFKSGGTAAIWLSPLTFPPSIISPWAM